MSDIPNHDGVLLCGRVARLLNGVVGKAKGQKTLGD